MNNKKVFKSINELELVVSYKKSAVIFEIGNNEVDNRFVFRFDSKVLKELFDYLKEISNKAWDNIQLKKCNSMGSDYAEYYDRKLDNNGYLSIGKGIIELERVSIRSNKLYQFNKSKIQSFLYDYKKIIESLILRGKLKY